MDLPDNNLDVWIDISLQPGTSISPQQKQFAWERLSEKAMQQTILPAALLAEEKSYTTRFWESGLVLWRCLSAFATEEDRYERAHQNRYQMRYQYFRPNGELALQFLSPLRLSI